VLRRYLIAGTKLLFWFTPMIYKLFFMLKGAIILANYDDQFCIYLGV
jgi:hypothetical protein